MNKFIRKYYKMRLICTRVILPKRYMKYYNDYLRKVGVHVDGFVKYIHKTVYLDVGYAEHIHIGNNCVFSVNTVVLAHDFSLECGLSAIQQGNNKAESVIIKDVVIGDNVWKMKTLLLMGKDSL